MIQLLSGLMSCLDNVPFIAYFVSLCCCAAVFESFPSSLVYICILRACKVGQWQPVHAEDNHNHRRSHAAEALASRRAFHPVLV